MSDFTEIERFILYWSNDDWVFGPPVSSGFESDFSADEAATRTNEAYQNLVRLGLIDIGHVGGDAGPGFHPWPGGPDTHIARLQELATHPEPEERLGFWGRATPEGEKIAATIPDEWFRDDD
ncbi:hypothetical protein SAMN05444695_101457 [Rhodococcus triatomae]|uniref:Uncharacterized protein n=2 Tax=Rhodococcus triatomae TaxID=300028 RepID=A0A1G8AKB7_9NOCA|nr:hypothetical protein [Rhodococcus triatomae]SDH21414.1 hypothetical protein SAMN05444695_101457 [Rhodococcus triatomae]